MSYLSTRPFVCDIARDSLYPLSKAFILVHSVKLKSLQSLRLVKVLEGLLVACYGNVTVLVDDKKIFCCKSHCVKLRRKWLIMQ